MLFNSTSFDVRSLERSNAGPDASVLKAGDGSVCIFTVIKCDDADARLELCAICSRLSVDGSSHCSPALIPVSERTKFKLGLGQAPDLAPAALISASSQNTHTTFRSVLESGLRGSKPGEVVTVRYSRIKVPLDVDSQTVFCISFQVNQVEHPPRCSKQQTLPSVRCSDEGTSAFTGGTKDPLENPTNDWNPELATHWSQRAWTLKERGTWLVQRHTGKREASTPQGDCPDLVRHSWSAAFECYSRALQLTTLARSARERCAAEIHPVGVKNASVTQLTSDTLDADQLPDCARREFDDSTEAVARLEFNLLLNLALCQLKAGSAEFASDNCTQALKLEPGWVNAVSDEAAQTTRVQELTRNPLIVSSSDVAKALYRRAQAYLRTGKAEEAKLDAESAIRLYSLPMSNLDKSASPNASDGSGVHSAAIAACEALAAQAVERMTRDKDILVERIRKRRNQL